MPGGSKRNLDHAENFTTFSSKLSFNQKLLVCDAQTSGGLLISLPPKDAKKFITHFGEKAKIIGEIQPRKIKPITVKF
jgi:selenide,water dikinase